MLKRELSAKKVWNFSRVEELLKSEEKSSNSLKSINVNKIKTRKS